MTVSLSSKPQEATFTIGIITFSPVGYGPIIGEAKTVAAKPQGQLTPNVRRGRSRLYL